MRGLPKLGRGERVFWTIALLIGIELLWLRFVEPGGPAEGALDPMVWQSPIALLRSPWGAILAWLALAILLWRPSK